MTAQTTSPATPRAIREAVQNDPTAECEMGPVEVCDCGRRGCHGIGPADEAAQAAVKQTTPESATSHEGVDETIAMWQFRRYLDAVRTFMELRAKAGERPTQTLGARNGAWAHTLMDRLIEVADDPARCKRETRRLEEQIARMEAS